MKGHAPMIMFVSIILFALAACGTESRPNEDSNGTADKPDSFEFQIAKDGFIYKLYTEKDKYTVSEEISIMAELAYAGELEAVTIIHGEPLLAFALEEKTRSVKLDMPIREIAKTRTLKKGKTIVESFNHSQLQPAADDKSSRTFLELVKKQGFPAGDYAIFGRAVFFMQEEEKHVELNGAIQFSVAD